MKPMKPIANSNVSHLQSNGRRFRQFLANKITEDGKKYWVVNFKGDVLPHRVQIGISFRLVRISTNVELDTHTGVVTVF
jgi:hypothetical protein